MNFRVAALVVYALLPACAKPAPAVHEPHMRLATRVAVELHADVRFTPGERAQIESVAVAWEEASNGLASIHVVYDADLRDIERQARHNLLLRVTSDTPYVGWAPVDAIAFTIQDRVDKARSQHIFVIIDRVEPRSFRHVVLHEIGHMLWISDRAHKARSLMAKDLNAVDCPTREDMAEFCAFHRCRLADVRWCEP